MLVDATFDVGTVADARDAPPEVSATAPTPTATAAARPVEPSNNLLRFINFSSSHAESFHII